MDVIFVYAVVWCGISLLCLCGSVAIQYRQTIKTKCLQIARLFSHRNVIGRYRYFGPISFLSFATCLIYTAVNIICLTYCVETIHDVAMRAGNLCLLNLAPLVLVFPLTDWCSAFGISFNSGLYIHIVGAYMCCGLISCHIVIMLISDNSVGSQNIYTILAAISFLGLLLLSLPFLRTRFYEIFLKVHQALAIILAVGTCHHLLPKARLQFRGFSCFIALSASAVLLRVVRTFYQNMAWGRLFTQATLRINNKTIYVTLDLVRPMKVDAGQYVYLWIPGVSFWAFTQIHPFSVITWEHGARDTLDLVIQPKRGLSAKIFQLCERNARKNANDFQQRERNAESESNVEILQQCERNKISETRKRAFISGPYGNSVPIWYYRVVVLLANDLGIIALLPYLEKLIHGYLLEMGCKCKVYLIWHTQDLDLLNAISPSLDRGLRDDPEKLFNISIYHEQGLKNPPQGQRLRLIRAVPDFGNIITQIVESSLQERKTLLEDRASVLILVSGTGRLRDIARKSIKKYTVKEVVLKELEYQQQ